MRRMLVRTRSRVGWTGVYLAVGSVLAGPSAYALVDSPAPGAVSPQTVKLPDKPASIKGLSDDASVQVFSAQVSYQVPLDLPKGRNGFGPDMTLTYSGDLGNGGLGIGWSLGLVSIRRSLRHGVPSYTDADELELVGLGGGRLVPDSGGRYWVEGQGQSLRIDRVGGLFVLKDSNGNIYVFGASEKSIQGELGRTSAWYLDTITNLVQDQIQFFYEKDQGQVYLRHVTWGPSPTSGCGGPAFRLTANRDDRPDVITSWATGNEIRTAKLYRSFEVRSFCEVLRGYELSYDTDSGYEKNPHLSHLTKVHMIGRAGQGALPDLSFAYGGLSTAESKPMDKVDSWVLNQRGTSIADVDGDGVGDLLRLELGNHSYKKNLGGTFASPRSLSGAGHIDLESSRLMDVDGDARAELIYIVDDTWRVYRLNGEKWVRISDSPWPGSAGVPLSAPDTVFADINGDGCTDVIQGAFGSIRVRLGSRTGLSPVVRLPQIAADDATVEPGREDVRFVDMNGDGLADVVYLTDNWAKIWLGRGDGSFVYYNRVAYPWQQAVVPVSDIYLVDLDRDGLQDLIRIGMGTVEWYPGVADGSFSQVGHMVARPAGASVDSVVTIADANGNGSQDIVWSTPGGMWVLDMAGPTTAGMLTSIDNGMGKTTTFQYEGSGVLAIMDETAGKPWTYKLPTSIPVPIFATIDPGAGGPKRVVRYGIADGFWDGEERRFGGFLVGGKTVPAETRDDTLYEETRYYAGLGQDRVLRGKPYQIEQRDGADRLFTRKKIAVEARPVVGLPAGPLTRKPATTIEDSYNFENVSQPIETFSTYEYDDQVRLRAEHHSGRLDLTGDEKNIERFYASDEFYGVRDRVYKESVTAGDGTLISQTQTFYASEDDDPNAPPLPLGTIGRGWVAMTQGHVNAVAGRPDITETDIVLTKRRYDAFGNPTYAYENGVGRTLGYDSLSLHPTSESVSPATGKSLTWNMTWDNVLGQPKTVTDPNGVVTAVTYDSLGRQVTAAVDGKHPHTIHVYEWTAPKPHTTTYQWDRTLDTAPLVQNGQVPSGTGWRQTVVVANGAGEDLFSATRLTDTRWIVSGWKERDSRGHVVVHGDPFYWDGAEALAAKATEAKPASTRDLFAFRSQALEWDALGRLKKQTLPNLSTKSITYGAFLQTVTSSGLSPVISQTDGFGRIIHTERTVAGLLEQADATYDAADRLTLISLQGGRDDKGNLLPGKAEHSFTYDTLGRLVRAHDPDIGQREMKYDDRNLLIRHKNGAGNELAFFYDGAGRLTARGPRNDFAQPVLTYTEDPRDYRYSYDTGASEAAACPGQGGYTQGRLAAVDEPAGADGAGGGRVAFCYDSFGRQTGLWRRIGSAANGKKAWQWNSLAASGLLLWRQADDGFKLFSDYDRAGRLTILSDSTIAGVKNQPVWSATPDSLAVQALDASGRVLTETYGQSALAQSYLRDALGMPSRIQVDKKVSPPSSLYDVEVPERTPYGAPKTVRDLIDGGIDHSASYAYDGAARLTNAILGQGSSAWKFRFEYDGLQNMTGRMQEPPAGRGALPILAGTYHYGESDFGPRQLTSVVRDCVDVLNTYHYDGAGRMDKDGKKNLTYDGYDQLTSVTDNGASLVSHAYGYDGQRTYTKGAGNSEQYWFASDDTLLPGGSTRWHYISVADRLVARQSFSYSGGAATFPPAAGSLTWWPNLERKVPQYFVTSTMGGMLLLLGWAAWRRRRPIWQTAPAVACTGLLVLATPGCDHSDVEKRQQGIEDTLSRRYFHQGLAAGPALITKSDGNVADERRFEPFGEHIDANMALDPYNSLNKERNAETGWSYHGARWMAPQTARWQTPDPPVKAPDPKFMSEPWGLNPYTFVKQNPGLFWDANGMEPGFWSIRTLDAISNFVAGFGDSASLGLSGAIRDSIFEGGDPVDSSSLAYRSGVAVDLVTTAVVPMKAMTKVVAVEAKVTMRVVQAEMKGASGAAKDVIVSRARFPESARHIEEAQAAGRPSTLTIDRSGAANRRIQALKGTQKQKGLDRDEYPPAMFKEGGQGSSVKTIPRRDNRGSGPCIGAQCRGLPDGAKVNLKTGE